MFRGDVVRHLRLRIDEPESETRVGVDSFDQVVEITAPHRGQPRSLATRDWSLTKKARTRTAQSCAPMESVTTPIACGHRHLCSHLTAGALRIAAWEQGDAA